MLLPTNTLLMTDPLRLVRPNILALEPYATARDEFDGGDISVWLDANESPYTNGVNRYPDPHQKELKKAIARLGAWTKRAYSWGAPEATRPST